MDAVNVWGRDFDKTSADALVAAKRRADVVYVGVFVLVGLLFIVLPFFLGLRGWTPMLVGMLVHGVSTLMWLLVVLKVFKMRERLKGD